jgi:hypothetical protein
VTCSAVRAQILATAPAGVLAHSWLLQHAPEIAKVDCGLLTLATASFASVVLAPKDLDVSELLQTILDTAGISEKERRAPLFEGLAMMLFGCSLTVPIRNGELVLPAGHDLVVVSWVDSVPAPVPLVLSMQG